MTLEFEQFKIETIKFAAKFQRMFSTLSYVDCHSFGMSDLVVFSLLDISSSFMLSAAHNVFYFVLDIHTPVIHFLHFFFAFAFFMFKIALSKQQKSSRNLSRCAAFVPLAIAQLVVTLLSSRVHSQNRTGSLYLIRIFDFVTTLTVLKWTMSANLHGNNKVEIVKGRLDLFALVVPIALSASLSWLEFGHIEYDGFALFLAPILAFCQAIRLLLLRRAHFSFNTMQLQQHKHSAHQQQQDHQERSAEANFDFFAAHYTGVVCAVLGIPALVSYSQSVVFYDASWESIDYVLIGCSVIFMCGYKYAELWLQTHLEPHNFCVFEHTKFFAASCGQWFLQNMAHATVYAACGKLLFVVALVRYVIRIVHATGSSQGGGATVFWRKENEA